MFEGLPYVLIAGTIVSVGTTLYYEFRKVKERIRDLTMTKEHLHRMVDLKQMHNNELKKNMDDQVEQGVLQNLALRASYPNRTACDCGEVHRTKALFCHKCGRRKGT